MEINVRNTTSENTREVDTKLPKILVECNGYPDMFSLSGAVETFRRYLLIRTDILQKTVDGCPCVVTEWLPAGVINYNINDVLNTQQNRPRNPTTTVPKKETILVLPYLGAQSEIVTKQLKTLH